MAVSSELKSLDEVEYNFGVHKLFIVAGVILSFMFAFLLYFPFEKKIETLVKSQLATLPGCRANFNSLHFEFFLPKVVLTDIQLPASCLGGSNPIKLPRMALKFYGPSFSPFGLAFKMETELSGHEVGIHYAAGTSVQMINIQEPELPISALRSVLPMLPKIEGTVDLNVKVAVEGKNLNDLKILIQSQNLVVPAQNLTDFKIPRLALGNLSLKAESKGPRKIGIQEFILGKPEAAIRAKFSGTIDLATGAIAYSPVNMKGEAAFSEEFLQSFPILNLMLPQFTQKDGFYQIKLGGTLGNIRPN
ncbi:MAG: type II secretion system protein GspN [Bacteriovoracaceae bacterium]|nr:type II secretion system protein GspN [Bacteriovoracaceae bacterium]